MLELTINNFYDNDISEFVEFVMEELKKEILQRLSRRELIRVTEFLNSEYSPYYYLKNLRKPVTLYADEIFEGALDNLIFININNQRYKIFIDPNAFIPNTDIKYEAVMALITNGSLLFNPYTVFSDCIKDIDEDVPFLFEEYIERNE